MVEFVKRRVAELCDAMSQIGIALREEKKIIYFQNKQNLNERL